MDCLRKTIQEEVTSSSSSSSSRDAQTSSCAPPPLPPPPLSLRRSSRETCFPNFAGSTVPERRKRSSTGFKGCDQENGDVKAKENDSEEEIDDDNNSQDSTVEVGEENSVYSHGTEVSK